MTNFKIGDHVDYLTPYQYPSQDPNVVEYAWQEFLKKKDGSDQVEKLFLKINF